MAGYSGRSDVGMETQLFGGLNEKATIVNLKNTEATVCLNFDPVNDGSLRTRLGYQVKSSIASNPTFLQNYYQTNGTETYVSVCNGNFYESTDKGSTWNNRGAFSTSSANPSIGTDFNGVYYLANGVDAPIIAVPGSAIKTIKDASLISAPTSIGVTAVGSLLTTAYQYVVTAVTGRGETTPSGVGTVFSGPSTLSTASYNVVSWSGVTGAQAYNIYRYSSTAGGFVYLTQVAAGTISFTDAGQFAGNTYKVPPSSNTAYNTPSSWETDGQIQGFAVLARGRNQRLMAWRNNTVWVSSLNNGTDWFSSDSFQFVIQGGDDNGIKAVTTLFDFTVFFSSANAFFFTGSSTSDISLSKIIKVGCVSPHSFVQLADDVFLWSQFGPTTLTRVMAGADIKSDRMSMKIQISLYNSPQSKWGSIVAWHDIKNQKICWAYPSSSSSTTNDACMVFNYDVHQRDGSIGAWTKYSGWNVISALTAKDFSVYGLLDSGNFVTLHSGNTDGGTPITASYNTGFYNTLTYYKGRMIWLDIITDPSQGDYSFNVSVVGEFGRSGFTNGPYTLTSTSTSGDQNPWTGPDGNMHRIYTTGDNRMFQLQFSVTNSPNQVRIIGWRPDLRARGVR